MSELIKIEGRINTYIGKPLAWAVYALVLAARMMGRGLAICGRWLRHQWLVFRSPA